MQLEEAKEVLVHYFRTAIGDDKFTSESQTEIENAIDSIIEAATSRAGVAVRARF